MYPLDDRATRKVTIIGARTIEERQDFWIAHDPVQGYSEKAPTARGWREQRPSSPASGSTDARFGRVRWYPGQEVGAAQHKSPGHRPEK
jgi:hypothetical protein